MCWFSPLSAPINFIICHFLSCIALVQKLLLLFHYMRRHSTWKETIIYSSFHFVSFHLSTHYLIIIIIIIIDCLRLKFCYFSAPLEAIHPLLSLDVFITTYTGAIWAWFNDNNVIMIRNVVENWVTFVQLCVYIKVKIVNHKIDIFRLNPLKILIIGRSKC